jgi:hypothetical protein
MKDANLNDVRTEKPELEIDLEPATLGTVSEITEEGGESVLDRDNIVWGNF